MERNGGVDNPPALGFSLNIKLPIRDLVAALVSFQKNCGPTEQSMPMAGQNELPKETYKPAVVHAPVPTVPAMPMPPGAPPGLSTPPVLGLSSLLPQGDAPTNSTNNFLPTPLSEDRGRETPRRVLTWDNVIVDLQPGHDEYVKRTKWTADDSKSAMWLLTDDTCLREFKPQPLDPPLPVERLPGGLLSQPPEGPPPPPPTASTGQSQDVHLPSTEQTEHDGKSSSAPSDAGIGTNPSSHAHYSGRGESEGRLYPCPPDASPPPPPTSKDKPDKDEQATNMEKPASNQECKQA